MRWTRAGVLDEQCRRRTAKSVRSDAPMLAVKSAIRSASDVSNNPGHRGEREVSRKKTVCAGNAGLSGVNRVNYASYALFLFACESAGVN